jgi:hypothetical protein
VRWSLVKTKNSSLPGYRTGDWELLVPGAFNCWETCPIPAWNEGGMNPRSAYVCQFKRSRSQVLPGNEARRGWPPLRLNAPSCPFIRENPQGVSVFAIAASIAAGIPLHIGAVR